MKQTPQARLVQKFYIMCASALSLCAVGFIGLGDASAKARGASRHGKTFLQHSRKPHITHVARYRVRHRYRGGRVIQCVAYAKTASNVHLHGNARDWWHNAQGIYARGEQPEAGAVLNFRPIRRMPLGHVAVVRQIVDDRTIVIDQSHWGQRGVARNTRVIDVSPNNDWSAVRVALNGNPRSFGSIYPTYGFIYERPDDSNMLARQDRPTGKRHQDRMTEESAPTYRATEIAQAPENAFAVDGPEHRLQ